MGDDPVMEEGEVRKMMKVFISQPMNGKQDSEIKGDRERIIGKLDKLFMDVVEPIDSYFEDYEPKGGKVGLKYLSKSLDLLADADAAYFAKGWSEAHGCRIEHECARAYGITIIEEGN